MSGSFNIPNFLKCDILGSLRLILQTGLIAMPTFYFQQCFHPMYSYISSHQSCINQSVIGSCMEYCWTVLCIKHPYTFSVWILFYSVYKVVFSILIRPKAQLCSWHASPMEWMDHNASKHLILHSVQMNLNIYFSFLRLQGIHHMTSRNIATYRIQQGQKKQ